MLTIAGKQINTPDEFSQNTLLVLRLVYGGESFLSWLLSDAAASLNFASEYDMVLKVQQGLHIDNYVRFTDFRVDVRILLAMPVSDLNTLLNSLAAISAGEAVDAAAMARVLASHGLLTYAQIAEGTAFLTANNIVNTGIFSCMSFAEQIALVRFVNSLPSDTNIQGMCDFALWRSNTVTDFINICRFYIATAAQTDYNRPPTYNSLQMLSQPLLFTAQLPAGYADYPVQAIMNVAQSPALIGFRTITDGIGVLAFHVPLDSDEVVMRQGVTDYMAAVKRIILSDNNVNATVGMTQDGELQYVNFSDGENTVTIGIDAIGTIFITTI